MNRSPYLKEPNLKDYNFEQCSQLSTTEQLKLARTYQEIVCELNMVGAYPGAKITEEKKQATFDNIMPIIEENPDLKYMYYYDKSRNYSSTIARECIRSGCTNIVKQIILDDKAVTSIDHMGRNIGMISALEGNEEITLLILDNETARRQQSNNGHNIGMISAKNKLIQATLKSLDDDIASAQQSADGETIGMICARVIAGDRNMIPVFEKAASNHKTILIQDNQGRNIIDIARASSYAGATLANKFERTLLEAQLLQPELDK